LDEVERTVSRRRRRIAAEMPAVILDCQILRCSLTTSRLVLVTVIATFGAKAILPAVILQNLIVRNCNKTQKKQEITYQLQLATNGCYNCMPENISAARKEAGFF
jgi:hypothetical protein